MSKFLINDSFKAVRMGAYVEADSGAGEFIFDSEDRDTLKMAQYEEIAAANNLEISAKKKSDFHDELVKGLSGLKLPTQNEPTESAKVEEIVLAGHEAGKTDDQMLIEIVTAGISFRKAGKMFKDTTERLGLRVALKDVKAEANTLLEDISFNPASYDDVQAAIDEIMEKVEGCTHQQARTAVRKFAKDNDIALPKPPQGQRGAIGFKVKVFDWILENPNASLEDLGKFGEQNKKDAEKIKKQFGPVLELCQKFAKKHSTQ